MDNILDLLTNSDMGKQIIGGISEKTNIPLNETSSVVTAAVPALLGALQNNATSEEGASSILGALTSKHNGSILDNISGFFGGGDNSDGNGILKNILGDKQAVLENGISSTTGVSSGNVSKIMVMLAPIVMGLVGKQLQGNKVGDSGGLTGMLSGMLGGNSGSSIFTGMLDQNGDGKLGMDDIVSVVKGKSGGFGKLLGGLFGKK